MTVKEAWEEDLENFVTNNLWINKGIVGIIISYIKSKYSVSPLSTPENTTDNNEVLN